MLIKYTSGGSSYRCIQKADSNGNFPWNYCSASLPPTYFLDYKKLSTESYDLIGFTLSLYVSTPIYTYGVFLIYLD